MIKLNKTKHRVLVCSLPIVVVVFGYLAARFIIDNFTLPECIIYRLLGWHCPGCGNTRAVIALMQGDLLLSLRQNPMIIILLFTVILLYAEVIAKSFDKKWRSPIRNYYYLYGVMIGLIIFYILRNFIPILAPICIN